MYTVLIFNSIVVFLAWIGGLSKNRNSYNWLKLSFVFIFLFLSLRYDFGNDYQTYLKMFNSISYVDYDDKTEVGWQYLCLLFQPYGFFVMLAVLAAINCYVYYNFIKEYVPSHYYWLAVFVYVFNPYMMLVHSSAMRQSLAITIFILAIKFLYEKKYILYLLIILTATLVHRSSSVLLLMPLMFIWKFKFTRLKILIMLFFFVILLKYSSALIPYVQLIVNSYFEKYEGYQNAANDQIGTGLGVLYYAFTFIVLLYYTKYQNSKNLILFKIATISYYIMGIGLALAMAGRIEMYFQIVFIVVIPLIVNEMKARTNRLAFVSSYLAITLYSFYGFFQSYIWRDAFGVYKTIFSAPKIF